MSLKNIGLPLVLIAIILSSQIHGYESTISFKSSYPKIEITFPKYIYSFTSKSMNAPNLLNEGAVLEEVHLKISGEGKSYKELSSNNGLYKSFDQVIDLGGDVILKIINDDSFFKLNSDELNISLEEKLIYTDKSVSINKENIKIRAEGFELRELGGKDKITLKKATIISSVNKKLGESDKLTFYLDDPNLLMEGSAKIVLDDFIINASEISYNLNENKIINAKDSSIITNK